MPARADVAAIVLAAGRARRMGAFKPLLPFGPCSVIERVLATLREAGVASVHVVVGWKADRLTPLLDREGVPWVRNDRFEEGMYASLQAGIRCLPPAVRAFFLFPGDMPLVRSATLTLLIAERDRGPTGILYPCCGGRRGHPPLIATSYAAEILREAPADGLRALLAGHDDDARDVECADPGVLVDLDTPEEYLRARGLHQSD